MTRGLLGGAWPPVVVAAAVVSDMHRCCVLTLLDRPPPLMYRVLLSVVVVAAAVVSDMHRCCVLTLLDLATSPDVPRVVVSCCCCCCCCQWHASLLCAYPSRPGHLPWCTALSVVVVAAAVVSDMHRCCVLTLLDLATSPDVPRVVVSCCCCCCCCQWHASLLCAYPSRPGHLPWCTACCCQLLLLLLLLSVTCIVVVCLPFSTWPPPLMYRVLLSVVVVAAAVVSDMHRCCVLTLLDLATSPDVPRVVVSCCCCCCCCCQWHASLLCAYPSRPGHLPWCTACCCQLLLLLLLLLSVTCIVVVCLPFSTWPPPLMYRVLLSVVVVVAAAVVSDMHRCCVLTLLDLATSPDVPRVVVSCCCCCCCCQWHASLLCAYPSRPGHLVFCRHALLLLLLQSSPQMRHLPERLVPLSPDFLHIFRALLCHGFQRRDLLRLLLHLKSGEFVRMSCSEHYYVDCVGVNQCRSGPPLPPGPCGTGKEFVGKVGLFLIHGRQPEVTISNKQTTRTGNSLFSRHWLQCRNSEFLLTFANQKRLCVAITCRNELLSVAALASRMANWKAELWSGRSASCTANTSLAMCTKSAAQERRGELWLQHVPLSNRNARFTFHTQTISYRADNACN